MPQFFYYAFGISELRISNIKSGQFTQFGIPEIPHAPIRYLKDQPTTFSTPLARSVTRLHGQK